MDKKRKHNRLAAAGVAAAFVVAFAAPASAATDTGTQTIDATLQSSITLTLTGVDVAGWSLAAVDPLGTANTLSTGSMDVTSNGAYAVTVQAAQPTLTEWDGSVYGSRALAAPLSITATGGPLGTPSTVGVTNTVATPLVPAAVTVGLGTDSYTLSISQPTTIADEVLPATSSYHNVVTYTATSVL